MIKFAEKKTGTLYLWPNFPNEPLDFLDFGTNILISKEDLNVVQPFGNLDRCFSHCIPRWRQSARMERVTFIAQSPSCKMDDGFVHYCSSMLKANV
jgi:hypothetical protein